MRKHIFSIMIAAAMLALSLPAAAEIVLNAKSVELTDVTIKRSESDLDCKFNMSFANCPLSTNRELRLHPYIVGADGKEKALPGVIVAGRNRYIYIQRSEKLTDATGLHRYTANLTLPYSAKVGYEPWMANSRVELRETALGCCSHKVAEYTLVIDSLDFAERIFRIVPVFIVPEADSIKTRSLKGSAFIDFPVNRTEIRPDYRGNHAELAKIQASIDSVRNDKDVTITSLSIKGFASPEGPYDNNVRLAKGRTAALKTYVEQLYRFAPDFIKTSYEPEDWEGLRNYVTKSNIDNREALLAIINSNLAPDARDNRLRTAYPVQYSFLLQNVYPALRHSDYTIDYTIRSYTSTREILEILYTRPQNLSLDELFTAAKTLKPGSKTYNDLFETAVRMYPTSEVANLNAASVALASGNAGLAEKYLSNAGQSAEAVYSRGVLAALRGDWNRAKTLFTEAKNMGIAEADEALRQTERCSNAGSNPVSYEHL